jgi:hypothetical protein
VQKKCHVLFEWPLSQKDDHQNQKFNFNDQNQEQWFTQSVIVLL